MKKFEYKVFNLSVVTGTPDSWLVALNRLGESGWELVLRLNTGGFLLKREIKGV